MSVNVTLFINLLCFIGFVVFCMKMVWPLILGQISERQRIISEGLAAASEGQQAQAQAEKEASQLIKDAKSQAAEIIANAEKRGNGVIEEAKNAAVSEKERIVSSAMAEVEQEVHGAREVLRGQVSSIAIAAASKIVDKEIDQDAHAGLIEDLVSQLNAS